MIGNEFSGLSLEMADFLRNRQLDVVCVEYTAYETDSGDRLLTMDSVRQPLTEEETTTEVSTVDLIADGTVVGSFEHSVQAELMAEVVEELIQRHGLADAVSLPYVPTNGELALLNDVPSHPDEEEMQGYQEVGDNLYLNTNYSAEQKEQHLQTLADECGIHLRAEM